MDKHPTQLTDCPAHVLTALYRSGQATPLQATQAVLARISACMRIGEH